MSNVAELFVIVFTAQWQIHVFIVDSIFSLFFAPAMFQVTDKRVSRNHAIVEISDGKLVITPVSLLKYIATKQCDMV